MRKEKFNSIIVKDKNSDGLVFISFEDGRLGDSYFQLDLPQGFIPNEEVNGKLPSNKIVLSKTRIKSETDLAIIPKYCIELKKDQKPLNFWHMVANPEHLTYLLSKIKNT